MDRLWIDLQGNKEEGAKLGESMSMANSGSTIIRKQQHYLHCSQIPRRYLKNATKQKQKDIPTFI